MHEQLNIRFSLCISWEPPDSKARSGKRAPVPGVGPVLALPSSSLGSGVPVAMDAFLGRNTLWSCSIALLESTRVSGICRLSLGLLLPPGCGYRGRASGELPPGLRMEGRASGEKLQDVQNKLKESAQCVGDEFMNCKLATRAKDFLPADIQAQFAISRELIRNIYNSFHKLRDRAERIASRAIDNAADLLIFGKELSAIGSDTTPLPSWAALNSSTWGSLKQALKGLSVEFALLADKAAQQGKQEENDVVEKLNLFLDLLQSYKDLCERHEKGVLHKHQRALHKYSLMKRQMMSAAVQNREPESVEQLESRIVEQENAIQTMELRNYFSLYCLHQETQLIHVYLPLTSHILRAFVNSQIQGHKEMSKVWNDLRPKLSCLFAGPHSALTPPRSPPQSPPEDGLCPH
ncbi:sorting nexin-8 isoform X3 [Callithrix jacchus]